jgi:type VI secretion system protein ImpC
MSESIQKKLLKVRPPRVKITYDIETEGASISKELPVVLGIIGDYSGMRDESKPFTTYKERKFIYLNGENFNDVLKSLTPRVIVTLPVYKDIITVNTTPTDADKKEPQENKAIELIFENFDDFQPLSIINKIDFLKTLYDGKKKLSELRLKTEINSLFHDFIEKITTDSGFKDTIKTQASTKDGKDIDDLIEATHCCSVEQKPYVYDLILNYITILELPENSTYKTFIDLYNNFVVNADKIISYYLNGILHDENFQKLEGSWRGLVYILQNSIITDNMRIKLFNASVDELFSDLTKAMEFDQSILFKKVYEAEYGTFGGTPYTSMMFDFSVTRNSRDVTLLRKMTEVMAAAHCPLFLGVSSSLFGLKNFNKLNEAYSISTIFDNVDLAEYRSFREMDDAKYANLLLPRIISRLPYNTNLVPIPGLNFIENVSGINDNDYTWMNAAYAYMSQIANAYAMYGWFTTIVGVENGGKVDSLPLYIYKNANGESVAKCPTEVAITDRREKELSDLGFITLCNAKDENYAVFFGSNNAFKPPLYTSDHANANGDLSSRTPYMLNMSRIAHYLKCMMRDKIGSFMTANGVKKFLCEWLAQYTLLDDNAPTNLKAEYPIREFSIKVDDIPGKPGQYKTIVLLRPHNQLQAIEISLRLVAQMPK